MYREIYNIPFKSINENSYKVIIEKDGFTGSTTELTGAESPFTVETSLENPISPFRLSTATLRIFGGDYLQNLFTPNPQGVRVKLLKNSQIEWLGFLTNDTYSQDYSNTEFVYEIELVNPISTLKYKKFAKTTETITFIDLIKDAISNTNSEISKIYLPTSITNTANQNIYNLITISSSNFIDEQGKEMNYYETLEEVAKYLSLTITVDKDSVYFIDYIGIKNGFNQYYLYQGANVTTVTLTDNNTIQDIGYSGSESRLSINSGKNKAKVTCSLFDIDEILPEFDNKGATDYPPHKTQTVGDNTGIIRYYKQPKYTFYKTIVEQGGSNPIAEEYEGDRLGESQYVLGSCFVRTTSYKESDRPSRLSLENEVQIRNYYSIASYTLGRNSRIISFKTDRFFTFNKNVYFCFNCSVKFNNGEFQFNTTINTLPSENIYVPVQLRIGNYYYSSSGWTTTESKFSVPIKIESGHLFGLYHTVEDTNDFTLGLGDLSGFIFKAPDFTLSGNCELTIYNVSDNRTYMVGNNYTYIKDISFDYAIPNEQSIYGDWVDNKSDITYENVIDGDYVEEADEVELKICTFPEDYNKLCYSSTFIGNDLLSTLKYRPLDITDMPERVIINRIIHYYSNPKYQVSIPVNNADLKPYTTITDSNLSGKTFIYAGNEIDYEFEKNTINMLEI